MNYKFPYKAHFQRNVGIYIGLIALLVTGYLFVVKGKSALKKHQKFNLFFSVSKVDAAPLKEKIEQYVDQEIIKQVVINNANPSLSSYYTMYSTFGLEDADVLILEKEAIIVDDLKSHFLTFDASSSFYADDNYVNNDIHYGLEAYKGKEGCFAEYVSYEEDGEYYLFVNKKSEHLLEFVEEGKTNSVWRLLKEVYGG